MAWQQLHLQMDSIHADFIEQQLLDSGAVSVTYLDAKDQPVFQQELGSTPMWDETVMLALFEANSDLSSIVQWLASNPAINNRAELTVEKIADQDWERSWMTDFKAMRFGERLWVCPSWEAPPEPDAINLVLDPGLAFGSGSHATTGLCLEWLDQAELKGKTVIDYGCGSGVLAIAAVLLGASRVIAVDNDPQAIIATAANRQNNGIAENVLLACLPDAQPTHQADILLANILAAPLIELAPHFAALTRPGGQLVLSGLLPEQADAVIGAYTNHFDMAVPCIRDQWVRLTGIRRD